jgi:hypothetical protein
VGLVQFVVLRHFTTPHRTKQDAEKDKDLFDGDTWTHRYTFTYQNGAWVAEANQCEQGEQFVMDDRESGRNRKAKFGFHDCVNSQVKQALPEVSQLRKVGFPESAIPGFPARRLAI